MKLSTKIFLPIIMIVLIGGTLTVVLTNVLFNNICENDVEERMYEIADRVKTAIKTNAGQIEEEQLVKKIYDYNRFSGYAELAFFDADYQVLHKKQMYGYNNFFLMDFVDLMEFNSGTFTLNTVKHADYVGETYYTYMIPFNGGQTSDLAYIALAKDMGFYDLLNNGLLLVLLPISILIAVGSIVIALIVSKKIAQPIYELEAYALNVTENNLGSFTPSHISSEIHSLGESIIKMSNRLTANHKQRKIYFDNASHELKTPLMVIKGYAEGIVNGVLPDSKEAAAIIANEADRLNKLVGDLMTLAEMDREEYAPRRQEIILDNFLEDIVTSLSEIKSPYLTINLKVAENIILFTDEEMLKQALLNPIINSLRYAKSFIQIQVDCRNNEVQIVISDDGGGIAETMLPHIFERFYKGEGGKSGLGMAIMKTAAENIGGRVEVHNSNVGVIYKIILKS